MFPTQQLIMNSSKLRQFYRLIYIKSSPQSLCVPSRTFARDKLLKIDACNTISTHVQLSLNFTTSSFLNTDIETMSDKRSLDVDYNGILKAQKDSSVLIIDVREKEEIDETGKLPGSIHIPMGEVANTLLRLSEKDFKEKFNREKPSKDTKIILSCRSGKRSSMVQEEIQKLGYQNAYNYVGGWLDWENNQKV